MRHPSTSPCRRPAIAITAGLVVVLAVGCPAPPSEDEAAAPGRFLWLDRPPATTDRASTGGVSWVDVDDDGDPDLVVTNGYDVSAETATPQPNRLYLNDGTGRYTAVEAGALTSFDGFASGSTWADADGDGDLDGVVAHQRSSANVRIARDRDGDGLAFAAIDEPALAANADSSFSAAWVDVDLDGTLDLWVANGGLAAAEPDALYRGTAGGLEAVADAAPVVPAEASGGGVWDDYDLDGDPDLFVPRNRVTRDGSPVDVLYRNDGEFRFSDVTAEAFGDLLPVPSIAAAWGDMDGDGDPDLFVCTLLGLANRLFENLGDGTFRSVDGPLTLDGGNTYGAAWGDLDHDGQLDLVVAEWGSATSIWFGDGRGGFERAPVGVLEPRMTWASSVALADHDGDGDLDVAIGNWPNRPGPGERNALIENDVARGRWLRVRLEGASPNRSAIGARVEVRWTGPDGTPRSATRTVSAHTGWRSQGDLVQHFGLGEAAGVDRLAVRWPDGTLEAFEVSGTDRTVVVHQGAGSTP